MAAADGAAPPAPPPACSRLVLAADDVVVCLWFAGLWFLVAGSAAVMFTEFLGCAVEMKTNCPMPPGADAAYRVAKIAWLFFAVICPFAAQLLSNRVPPANTEEEKGLATKEQGLTIQSLFVVVVDSAALVPLLFFAVAMLLTLSWSVKGALVVLVGMSAILCFIVIPAGAVWIWRVRQSARRYHPAFLVSTICYDHKAKKFRCFGEQEIKTAKP